jgi:murein DD-endopeptidase MepM/ murein hydrolase activator NlpD
MGVAAVAVTVVVAVCLLPSVELVPLSPTGAATTGATTTGATTTGATTPGEPATLPAGGVSHLVPGVSPLAPHVTSSGIGVVGATAPADPMPPDGAAATTYALPVPPPVVVRRGFEPPPGPYAAGHRGVDFDVGATSPVYAAAAGRVSFSGQVAGRGVVVIMHADGISTEYEPVRPSVVDGAPVARGDPIGAVEGEHGGCPDGLCLHWGARRDGDYLDPMGLLRALGVVRLLPSREPP